jgi:hypothetical protein
MIDRLVCADGGNPDPTTTHGKDRERPRRSSSRAGLSQASRRARRTAVVSTATWPASRRRRYALSDWLDWMGLIDAGPMARLDRFIGYYEPYATSHEALDRGTARLQEEVRNVARAVARAVGELRAGKLSKPDAEPEAAAPEVSR